MYGASLKTKETSKSSVCVNTQWKSVFNCDYIFRRRNPSRLGSFPTKNGDWKSKLSSAWRNTFSRGHKKREWRRLLVMYIFSHICTSFNLFHSYLEYISVICVWSTDFYWKRELHDWVFALRLVNDARLPPKWRVLLGKMGIRGETCPTEKAMVLTDVNVIWWTCALHWWSTTFPDCAAHTDIDEDLSTDRTTAFTQGCE